MRIQRHVQQVRRRDSSYQSKVTKIQESYKRMLTEALKAEDYEAAIVMGWYELHERELDNKSGINAKVVETIKKNPAAQEAGRKIANYILKNNPSLAGADAEQYGRASTKLTSFWTLYGATNKTPKTDILIGDMRFSLKIGVAQLMSGGKAESTATFYAALKNSDDTLVTTTQFQNVSGVVDSFVEASVAPGQLRGIIKSGQNEIVNKGEAAHKECMAEMSKLFEQSREFKIAFAREAMSGFEKFGAKDNAAAEYMLVATHDGGTVSIHSVYDDAYCEKIADAMKLQARFKTSSRKLKGRKTGEYNYWSVISLIVNAMNEEIIAQGDLLTEASFISKVTRKLRGFFSRTWKKITGFFKKSASNMMSYLGLEPNVKVSNNVKFD